MECWNTITVHLVIASVVEWMAVAVYVIMCTIIMMMIFSVSVTGKVLFMYAFVCHVLKQDSGGSRIFERGLPFCGFWEGIHPNDTETYDSSAVKAASSFYGC